MTTTKTQPADTRPEAESPKQIIGRFIDNGKATESPAANGRPAPTANAPIAVFCHDTQESYIGGHVADMIPALARRGQTVHLFCRTPFTLNEPNVQVHAVGTREDGDIVEQAQEFCNRAANAFMQHFRGNQDVAVIGYEWASAPVLSLLRGLRNLQGVLSLHSLEQQRSDVSSDIARRIAEIEQTGLREARSVLVHDAATGEAARLNQPECQDRLVSGRMLFPMKQFQGDIDPGAIKARYQVGPVDPTILCVGDLDERYGPDLIVKAMPAILRHHPQARLVIVGDGNMFWPLRVYTRYLLLEHAVRLVGSVTDTPLYELVQAADMIVVPSRESTPWWPILAGWAARRPVVATHEAAKQLTEHEKDSVLVYPSENSIVWGVERVLYDASLAQSIGQAGKDKLQERFGWNALAEQLEDILGVKR